MLDEVDEIGRTEERSRQMIEMHGYPDFFAGVAGGSGGTLEAR
jgi:hypothetical protein